jgi:NADPH-dependent 2,4-dienoyl-CoA reductase/sulfur reductase-like enzyme
VAGLVIVGASLAGLRAAQAARAAGYEGELTIVGDEQRKPYTRPPLSKGLLAGVEALETCWFPCDELDVTWRLGSAATRLDPEAQRITLADDDALAYDTVVLATGCRARPWTGPGAELAGLHTLRDLDDALELQSALTGAPRLAVVGAGFIGCEVAASARALGLDVTLLDIAPLPMPALGETIGRRVLELHRERGVDVRLGAGIRALHGNDHGRVERIELADGATVDCDVAVIALGAIPNTEWLASSGLELEPGVVCDPTLQAAPGVYVAGDIAAWPHPLAGDEVIRVEHWTNAAEQGTLAGRNAVVAPDERKAYTAVPSFWSDQYDVKIQAVGLPRRAEAYRVVEATAEGDRWIAIGEAGGKVVAALGWNGARRLPWYRRQIGLDATPDALLAALAEDPKSFGAPQAVGA